MSRKTAYLGNIVNQDVVEMTFAREELYEILPLCFRADSSLDFVSRFEEGQCGVPSSGSAREWITHRVTQIPRDSRSDEAGGAGDEDVVTFGDGRHGEA